MPARIREYCARHGQPVPPTVGAVARCVVDSLALSYRTVVDDVAAVTGRRPPSISIVGGGANHTLLSQLTADATRLPVHCGPVEATALGNGAVQLAALGELSGPDADPRGRRRRLPTDQLPPAHRRPLGIRPGPAARTHRHRRTGIPAGTST